VVLDWLRVLEVKIQKAEDKRSCLYVIYSTDMEMSKLTMESEGRDHGRRYLIMVGDVKSQAFLHVSRNQRVITQAETTYQGPLSNARDLAFRAYGAH